ncbi:MAG: transglutaminase domain-containing protein [Methanobrevibacter sp.]|nr:transglutaminase domain-containing protein [Methanobrevibacter sp.]MBR1748855.1 transglutaminase domain-containing protein [Bacilli bacterium]
MANNLLEKNKSIELIQESARDLLTMKLTLPLGNPALKKVHTNQFCFYDWESTSAMHLKNWEKLAEVYSSIYTRFGGYKLGRWYIETNTIDVDIPNRKAEMKLELNAFPSKLTDFTSDARKFQEAYNNLFRNNTNSSSKSTSSGKKTTNSTSKNNTKLFPTKAGRNISTNIKTAAKQITEGCNTEEQRAYCIYDWVDKYVSYKKYWGYGKPSSAVISSHTANCWDTAFLIYNLCSACKPKVRCEIYNGRYHFIDETCGHLWNKLPYKGKMTFADTGRSNRNPIGSHGGSGRYIVSGGSSPYKKNY